MTEIVTPRDPAGLVGQRLPRLPLPATDGRVVDLAALTGTTVLYAYPRTSPPGAAPIDGWDDIPGARGCTPQSCGFRDHHEALKTAGAAQVFGLSAQDRDYQREAACRLQLPFALLSDDRLLLADALGLPRFVAGGMTLLARLTLIITDGQIAHVAYPVTDPAGNAEAVLRLLKAR